MASGTGLSLTTAGAVSSFAVTTRDNYGNLLDSSQTVCTTSVACASGTTLGVYSQYTHSNKYSGVPSVRFSSQYAGAGVWDVLVSGLRVAGLYTTNVVFPHVGGLQATYYAYSTSLDAVSVVDGIINPGNGGENFAPNNTTFIATAAKSTPQTVVIDASAPPASVSDDANGYAVRWAGYIRTPCASACDVTHPSEYTFQFTAAALADRVRLWIDNTLVIDQWESLGHTSPTGTMSVLQSESLHDIRIWYRHDKNQLTGNGAALRWSPTESANAAAFENVPTSRMYVPENIKSTPVAAYVRMGTPSADYTRVQGSALSISTAGTPAKFTVLIRDAYDNHIERNTSDASPPQPPLLAVHKAYLAGVSPLFSTMDNAMNSVSYTLTRSGTYTSSMAFYTQGGLTATYYQSITAAGTPFRTLTAPVVDVCPSLGCGTSPTGSGLPGNTAFSARFSGVVKPDAAAYTVKVTLEDLSDGVRVWVDGSLLIDAWSSVAVMTATAAVTFTVPGGYFDVAIEYK
jgi:hypothetical protein